MHMARHSSRKSVGRYDGQSKGVFVPPDLPTPGRSLAGKREVVHANVDDPAEIGKRARAAVNRRVSILEDQRSRGLLSEAAYRLGVELEVMFCTIGFTDGGQWRDSSRVDAASAHEHAIALTMDRAIKAVAKAKWMLKCVGEVDGEIIVKVLREGMRFADVAAKIKRISATSSGRRAAEFVAWRFRDALEYLAEAQAKGH